MRHHGAIPATAAASTITVTASAIVDAASAALCPAADATCRHLMASTAGRWPPPPVFSGATFSILTIDLASQFVAEIIVMSVCCFTRLEMEADRTHLNVLPARTLTNARSTVACADSTFAMWIV